MQTTEREPLSTLNQGLLNPLIEVHLNLDPAIDWHHIARTIKFMSYELVTNGRGRTENEHAAMLNQFVFNQKEFKIGESVLLNELIATRESCAMLLALFYIELGASLGLKFCLMHSPPHSTLRWQSVDGKLRYLDLSLKGKELSSEEILALLSRKNDQMRALTDREAFQQYLAYLATHFRARRESERLHVVLNFILNLEPENTRYIAERALLRKELGLIKDALYDMKRFFAFTEPAAVSPEILRMYEDLKAMSPS